MTQRSLESFGNFLRNEELPDRATGDGGKKEVDTSQVEEELMAQEFARLWQRFSGSILSCGPLGANCLSRK